MGSSPLKKGGRKEQNEGRDYIIDELTNATNIELKDGRTYLTDAAIIIEIIILNNRCYDVTNESE